MNALELLSHFRRLDIRVWLEDGHLNYSAPKGAFTPQLRDRLVAHKAEVIKILSGVSESSKTEPGIPVVDRTGALPLSFAQHRLWFLDRMEGSSSAYNMIFALRLTGDLNVDALRAAAADLANRHESLRTAFGEEQGEPVQIIAADAAPEITMEDIRHHESPERDRLIRERSLEVTARPFDLTQAPLIRMHLMRRDDDTHVLLLSMHHIISDGWSIGILVKELGAIYAARIQGVQPQLPELTVQYADYAHWQREWFSGEEEQRQLDYWTERLAGLPPLLELPTDRPRPPVLSPRGGQVSFRFDKALGEKLTALSRSESTSLFVTVLTAFQVLLSRYSEKNDVAVGSPIAGRNRPEVEGVVGFFVNNLVLRARIDHRQSFRELLRRVSRDTLSAYSHQDLPFERLVEAIQPERDLSHAPITQVRFIMLDGSTLNLSLPGLQVEQIELDNGLTKFDLLCTLYEHEQGLRGGITYSADLFDHDTIERMAGHYRTLLENIAAHPEKRICDLSSITPGEISDLAAWSHRRADYERAACIHELFEAHASRKPGAPAVIEGQTVHSHEALNAAANRIAAELIDGGLRPDEPVGLCTPRSAHMMAGILGALKAGGAYVPIDPEFPEDRVAHMVQDAGLRFVLTLKAHRGFFNLSVIELDDIFRRGDHPANPGRVIDANQLAYIIYTSGSTGKPKGVGISHGALHNYVQGVQKRLSLSEDAEMTSLSTMAADLGNTAVFGALCTGRPLRILSDALRLEPQALAAELKARPVDCLKIVPMHLAALLSTPETEPLLPRQCLVMGGDILERALIKRLRAMRPSLRIINHYGPTEATIGILTYEAGPGDETGHGVPIGRPLDNSYARVLDPWLGHVPLGGMGELCLGGESLARGYHKQPALTAEKLIPDPYAQFPGARLYRTGDRVRQLALDGKPGPVEFVGRMDHQVKIRGFRVEPSEIDYALKKAEGVGDAMVLIREDDRGEKHLAAYVTPAAGQTLSEQAIETYLEERLPDYMQPSLVTILDQLPLTSNGKVDRTALEAMGGPLDLNKKRDNTEPSTPMETQLAEIWRDVLGLDSIGVHANFFKLGGHSLLATLVMARLIEEYGVHISVKDLFEQPTVAQLAAFIQGVLEEEADETPGIEPVSREQSLPLSLFQQRLWFVYKLDGPGCAYNIPAAFTLDGALDVPALEWSLRTIQQRHEILRTTFRDTGSGAEQVIAPEAAITIPVIPLDGLAPAEEEAEVKRRAEQEARHAFDLEKGPLLRVSLLRLNDRRHVLLLTVHHIVFDGWSISVFANELARLYEARLKGVEAALPELRLQYADFAHWQCARFEQQEQQQSLEYWSEQLQGLEPVLPLPYDRPRPSVQSTRGKSIRFSLPGSLMRKLYALGDAEGASPFMTLMGAWQMLLARLCGQSDIAVGFPSGNRPRKELEPLIGFFINTLVLRTRVDAGRSFRAYLSDVRKTALEAFAHQDTPYEKIVETLQPERSLSHAPFTQIRFMLRNAPGMKQSLPGLDFSLVEAESGVSRYDLQVALTEREDRLDGYLQYNTDLFEDATARRVIGYFQRLLEALAEDPDKAMADVAILDGEERRFVIESHNPSQAPQKDARLAHQLMEAQVLTRGDEPALICADERMSYAEFNTRVNHLARYLQNQGVAEGGRVGVCLDRSFHMMTAMFAIMKTGAAYVPIDPALPLERIGYMVEDAGLELLLTDEACRPKALNDRVRLVLMDGLDTELASFDDANLDLALDPAHLAYVIYTSGSTGWPKGVGVSHGALVNYVEGVSARMQLTPDARMAALATVAADLANTSIFGALLTGRALVLPPRNLGEDPNALARLWEDRPVDALKIVPRHLAVLLRTPKPENMLPRQCLILGGEALDPALLQKVREIDPELRIINHYGPTEATVGILTHEIPLQPPVYPLGVPVGVPLANSSAYIADVFGGPAPLGCGGELLLGGPSLARGYLGKPGLTAERFIPNPFGGEPGERLYRTGDLARRLLDGRILFMGRVDHQVKIRGFRVEPAEIGAVLNRHPAVEDAAVIVRQDHNGANELAAYAVLNHGEDREPVTPELLQEHLSMYLPDYMVPRHLTLLDRMPLTPNGKIDRNTLQRIDLSSPGGPGKDLPYRAPRTDVEKTLVGIWEEVLEKDQIGIDHDFYEIGGHSLLAMLVVTRIREVFDVEVELRVLYEYRTVAALAEFVETAVYAADSHNQDHEGEFIGGEL